MAIRTKTQFKALYGSSGTMFPDNTTAEISEGDMRSFGEDIADTFNDASTGGVTREFNRTFAETINFDKNEIFYASHTMTNDINFAIGVPSLEDETSAVNMVIVADGVHAVNFGIGFTFIYGIQNGQVLDAGTYEFYFLYANGQARVNVPGVTQEISTITQLVAPPNFAVVADGENALDLSWDDVDNEVGYQIERSLTGTGGWTLYSNPAADATTATETGLNPNNTVYYRIKALGDGVTFADSPYSTAVGTTTSSGDVTAPTFTFLPANGNAVWPINQPLKITANEGLRNDDGSELTSANVATRITLKETNSGGANIAFTATIDVTKTIITITPTTHYGANQLVYLAIDNVEDVSGNEITVQSITFTTTEHTFFNGTTNRLVFGDILDSVFSAVDGQFKLQVTINEPLLSGGRTLWAKYSATDNQRSFITYINGTDVIWIEYFNLIGNRNRVVKWTNVLTAGEHDLEIDYDGSLDTNDGLDRATLSIDGVTAGSKTLHETNGLLGTIVNSTAQFSFGMAVSSGNVPVDATYYTEQAKDLIVLSGVADTEELNVPILRTGTDTSGNGRNGTWV